jgi:hypothetical protein
MMVFGVRLKMLHQIIDSFRQNRNLYFRRTRILLVGLKRSDNLRFAFFRQQTSVLLNFYPFGLGRLYRSDLLLAISSWNGYTYGEKSYLSTI